MSAIDSFDCEMLSFGDGKSSVSLSETRPLDAIVVVTAVTK